MALNVELSPWWKKIRRVISRTPRVLAIVMIENSRFWMTNLHWISECLRIAKPGATMLVSSD